MSEAWALLGCALALSLAPRPAVADGAAPYALELALSAGPSLAVSFAASPDEASTQLRESAVLRATLTTPYFLAPVLSVGLSALFEEPAIGGASAPREARLLAVPILGGARLGVGPVHLGAALGLFDMILDTRVGASRDAASELLLGYELRVGTALVEAPRARLGLELRTQIIAEASIVCFSVELSLAADVLRW